MYIIYIIYVCNSLLIFEYIYFKDIEYIKANK